MIWIDWVYRSNFICEVRPIKKMLRDELGVVRVLFFHEILGRPQKKDMGTNFEAVLSFKSLFEGVPRVLKCSYSV